MNIKESDREKKIIEKFKKQQTISIVLVAMAILIIPFIVIILYVADFYKLKHLELFIVLLFLIIPCTIISLRRCPNCGHFFGRYDLFS